MGVNQTPGSTSFSGVVLRPRTTGTFPPSTLVAVTRRYDRRCLELCGVVFGGVSSKKHLQLTDILEFGQFIASELNTEGLFNTEH